MQPYEVIAAPLELYLAPVGEAFPLIDTDPPGGNWVLVGASGSQRYDEDGVSIAHNEEIEDFRMLGTTGPVKSSRTEEELMCHSSRSHAGAVRVCAQLQRSDGYAGSVGRRGLSGSRSL